MTTGGDSKQKKSVPHLDRATSERLVKELKAQLMANEKVLTQLGQEVDRQKKTSSGVMHRDELVQRINAKDEILRELQLKFDEIEGRFRNQETIFQHN